MIARPMARGHNVGYWEINGLGQALGLAANVITKNWWLHFQSWDCTLFSEKSSIFCLLTLSGCYQVVWITSR